MRNDSNIIFIFVSEECAQYTVKSIKSVLSEKNTSSYI